MILDIYYKPLIVTLKTIQHNLQKWKVKTGEIAQIKYIKSIKTQTVIAK